MRKSYSEPAAEFFDRSSVPKEIADLWDEWRELDADTARLVPACRRARRGNCGWRGRCSRRGPSWRGRCADGTPGGRSDAGRRAILNTSPHG